MSAHDLHEGLPGYAPGQLLVDGCGECEARAKDPAQTIAHFTPTHFAYAWGRAIEFERDGAVVTSDAERPILYILWVMAVQLHHRGFEVGQCPTNYERGGVIT